MNAVKKKSNYAAPALEKGLDVLEYLAGQSEERSQAEVAQALGRNPSELYRMLTCLEDRGYILKEEGGTGYRLTLRLFELGHRQHTAALLRKASHRPMEELAEDIGQSCHLSFQHGTSMIVMIERMPARRVCLSVGEGATLPMSRTASGKILLSRLPEAAMERVLEDEPDFKSLTRTGQKKVQKQIAEARANGFLCEESELTEGVSDIAAPVGIDGSGTSAALAVSYLGRSKDADARRMHYLKSILVRAAEINQNLGVFG